MQANRREGIKRQLFGKKFHFANENIYDIIFTSSNIFSFYIHARSNNSMKCENNYMDFKLELFLISDLITTLIKGPKDLWSKISKRAMLTLSTTLPT